MAIEILIGIFALRVNVMNKNYAFILLIGLFLLVMLLSGCNAIIGQGETAAEGNRRHLRMMQLNTWMFADDIDRALYLDRPSRLTDKHVR